MIQMIITAIVAAFTLGNVLGGTLVYRHFAVSELKQKAEDYKADAAKYRAAVGIGSDIDRESAQQKARNDEILAQVVEKLNKEPEKVTEYVDVAMPLPAPVNVPGKTVVKTKTVYRDRNRPVCVDADSMRLFRDLK